jgi:acyl-CoA synthetase
MGPGYELRQTPAELATRYWREGLWTDDTLGGLVDAGLRNNAGKPLCVWSATRPYRGTIGAARELAGRVAGGLRRRGISAGDVVAFQLPNCVEATGVFWGASLIGATLVPIVHFYGPKEVGFILEEASPRVLITADRHGHLDYVSNLPELRRRAPSVELVIVVGDHADDAIDDAITFNDLIGAEPVDRPAAVSPDDPAVIAYTSGTTANPKGVIHTHRSLIAELHQSQQTRPTDPRPIVMGAPVGHAIGMLGGLLSPLLKGTGIHLFDGWDPATVLRAMVQDDLVFGGGATYFLTSLLDSPEFTEQHLAHLPHAGLGGSPVPAAVGERAARLGISLIRSYGSTEHPSISGASHDEPEAKRLYTDGHLLAGVDVRLIDADGNRVAAGEPGEIHSRGPELFAGYTDPTLTKETVDADGWYATGDIGILDADGWLTITDRKSDVIIRGGENVSAAEVESLLAGMPGVAEVAVVAAPDERLGEHGCAFIRPRSDHAPPTLEQVRRHLEGAGLGRQKWPEELRVIDEFPRTPSSKIKKYQLRALLHAER